MRMNLEKVRDEVRLYLASHPTPQVQLAEELGVSHSWLNKFVCGKFDNFGFKRLQSLYAWVERDRRGRR
jgi:predicted XRE-type DNA-binding protein